jgi:alkaline phosphatase D
MKTRLGTSKDDARIYSPGRRELLGLAGVSLLAQACGVGEGDGPLEVVAQDRAGLAVPPEGTPESNAFAMGVACGDVTAKDAIVWTQWSGTRELELAVYRVDGDDYLDEVVATAVPVEDAGFVHVKVSGLVAGARYRYVFFELDGTKRVARSPIGRFRAAIGEDALEPLVFGASACTSNGRAFDTLLRAAEQDLDLYLLLGDTTYNDGATSVASFRSKWRENLSTPGYRALRASTSLLATWDDHEISNDYDPERLAPATAAAARKVFFENQPLARLAEAPDRIWRKTSWGKTVDFFTLDCRSERKPSTRNGKNATYLSRAQMDWLKAGLLASKAVFKVILNSVPIGDFPGLFDFLKKDRWEGYPVQRDEILRHVEGNKIPGVLWVSGDFHLGSIGRVSPSGVGSNSLEILAGPGANSANPLTGSVRGSQFDYATGTSNFTSFALDPVARRVGIRFHDGAGRVLTDRSYPI